MFYEQERFILNSSLGRLIIEIEDPVGWRDVDISLDRSSTSDTLFTEIKQSLEFYKTGKEYLDRLFEIEASEAKVSLRREQFRNGRWRLRNEGFLDFSTKKWNKTKTSADYIENTFSEVFKNNFKEKFEVSRTEDINGNTLPALDTKVFNNTGHKIFLQSKLNHTEGETSNINALQAGFNNLFISNSAVPLTQVYNSDPRVSGFVSQSSFGLNFDTNTSELPISPGLFYIATGGNAQKEVNVKIKGSTRLIGYTVSGNFFNQVTALLVWKAKLQNDGTYKRLVPIPANQIIWESTGSDPSTFINQEITFDVDLNITLNNDEGIFFGWNFTANAVVEPLNVDILFDYPVAPSVEIIEDSYFEPTQNDVVSLFDAAERIVHIIDNEAIFESSLITDKYKDVTIASGETVRNILYNDEKPTIATTSFEEIYQFLFTQEPVGYDVTTVNGKNVVRLEPIEYFWNNTRKIDVSSSVDVEYEVDQNKLFSSIEIGYSESGKNEEIYGLQVAHGVNTFTTPINSTDTVYKATNKWIASPPEQELTRRKQYQDYPDEDAKYDKNTLVFDCVLNNGVYSVRDWQTDFEALTGIFSPDTFYNARFTPINCLLRHGKWFKSGMGNEFYETKYIRFGSTNGNKELITTLTGGNPISEGDSLLMTVFDPPILTGVSIKLTTAYTEEKEDEIRFVDNGERAAYGMLRFQDERGFEGFGIITSCEIKDSIKLELRQVYGF